MTIVINNMHYKLIYQPQSCGGCTFKGSHDGCLDANQIVDCGDHIFIPADCLFVRTRSGWYIHKTTGEVVSHDLSEEFGPTPIHIEGLTAYWYLDAFSNPVRESYDV